MDLMSGKHKYSDTINTEGITVVNTIGPLINSMAGSRSPNFSAQVLYLPNGLEWIPKIPFSIKSA